MNAQPLTSPSSLERVRRAGLAGFLIQALTVGICVKFIAEHIDRPPSPLKTFGICLSVVGLISSSLSAGMLMVVSRNRLK